MALELSQSMVAEFIIIVSTIRISKSQLFYWKTSLVSEEATVFTPLVIIGITVARQVWPCA